MAPVMDSVEKAYQLLPTLMIEGSGKSGSEATDADRFIGCALVDDRKMHESRSDHNHRGSIVYAVKEKERKMNITMMFTGRRVSFWRKMSCRSRETKTINETTRPH